MNVDKDLYTYLNANLPNNPIEQNKIAEDYTTNPAIMYIRRDGEQDLFLNGDASLFDVDYDIEVYGVDVDQVETTTDTLKNLVHGFKGSMGNTWILGAFVSDQASDYTPKVEMNTDEGLYVCTFALKLMF